MSSNHQPVDATEEALGRIVSRLEARVALLGELEALTRRRGEAIAKERFEALPRLEEARDAVLQRLLATSRDLESAARGAAGSACPDAVRLVGEATAVLARIEEADRRDQSRLKEASDRHRREIERVSVADRASRAYHGSPRASAGAPGHRTEHTA